jgi:multisubunit Na+/H+ antiporter MnhF subunit
MSVQLLQTVAAVLMALAGALFVARIVRGPSVSERILALDGTALTLVGYLLLEGDRLGGHYYLDAALALALLSFVATIALARATGRSDDE